MEAVTVRLEALWIRVVGSVTSPAFYIQLTIVAAAVLLAFVVALVVKRRTAVFRVEPEPGPLHAFRSVLFETRHLVFPALAVLLLGVAADLGLALAGESWLVRIAQSLAVVLLLFTVITRFVDSPLITGLLKWAGIPLATLHVFGWLDDLTRYLDGISIQVGNISLSALAVGRTVFFGTLLFWLGRVSSSTGQRVIRSRPQLDVGTREVIAKLFEISIFSLVFILLLQIMGLNLTALAVFSGALGVGLGFGLQKIAANFVSGVIILMDRSITPGDYLELEDGRAGVLRDMNMRSATLETFDGKDIVVPNETFISTAFTNWTHYNTTQRYSLLFSVAYKTELPAMFDVVRQVVAGHPQVIPDPANPGGERASVEIDSFGDSGINILVEYWMDGIDDGPNHVKADLMLMIWTALKAHGVEIPFPQREVSILTKAADDS